MSLLYRCAPIALVVGLACKNTQEDPESIAATNEPARLPPSPTSGGDDDAGESSAPQVTLQAVVKGLVGPTDLITAPDGTMVVLDQPGVIYRIDSGTSSILADLRERVVELKPGYDERGLLGMAYHPDYPRARRAYVYYSAPLRKGADRRNDHTNVLSEFQVTSDGRLDTGSERKLIELDWPAPNHDGGTVAFGPDRMLYFSMGDGGRAADIGFGHPPLGNGQDWTTLMGSILRIDPDKRDDGKPYGIPEDNPFAGDHEGADEIWAYGLRNGYAFSFDKKTGELFVGDVGQELVEEVNIIERGKNYGWSVKEGNLCFDPDRPDRPGEKCPDQGEHGEPLVDPIVTYAQPNVVVSDSSEVHGISVIGGDVYRGSAIPQLDGAYVFGDWSRKQDTPEGMLLVARRGDDGWSLERLPVRGIESEHIGRYIRGFGQDQQGEVYVVTSDREGPTGATGVVWRIGPG
jgi:glucose/arabinose dehydrogenase